MEDPSFSNQTVLIPGPNFHVDLSALDACHPIHYSRRLLIFRCDSAAQRDAQLASIKTGLKGLVSRCPILGGVVVPPPSDVADKYQSDWRTIIPKGGIELVVRDLRTVMASFDELEAAEFPPCDLPYNLLVPVPEGLGNDQPFAACKLQFSAIEGGTILTFAMSHSVADGSGTNELMRILGEETRKAQEHLSDTVTDNLDPVITTTIVGLDRSALRNMSSQIPFKIEDHPAYTWNPTPPSDFPREIQLFQATNPEVPVLLRFSAAGLSQLKADATLPGSSPISTHDALTALIWRSVTLIRRRRSDISQDHLASITGWLFMPSDARRHLSLPSSYIGNAVYQLAAKLDLQTLLSPSGLQHASNAIRRAITSVNGDIVCSLMAMTNQKWISWEFLSTASTTGVPMGTDWTSSMLYSLDWGEAFGPLVRYRYPGEQFNCVMPKLPDGGAELVVSVLPEEVETLKGAECFGKYISA